MTQTVSANELTLREVKARFGWLQVGDATFFSEWQGNFHAADLEECDRRRLDQTREEFLYLAEEPVHEEIVKLVMLSPLLSVAGFYRHPFRPVAERQVELVFQEEEEVWRGRLDILVLNETLWVTVLESKSKRFSVWEALPQTLFYMLASPSTQDVLFGFVTNGSELLFLKVTRGETPQYGMSRLFSVLNPGNDLYAVAAVLKRLGSIVTGGAIAA